MDFLTRAGRCFKIQTGKPKNKAGPTLKVRPRSEMCQVVIPKYINPVRLPYNKFIRLEGVDAPERGEKGGAAARHELERLLEGKVISYTEEALSYGRIVWTVKVGSKDVNKAMNNFIKKQK